MFTKKGFTLIELLVVVLIIGILAAIAVPKYQKAVGKADFMNYQSMAASFRKAHDIYVLQTGGQTSKDFNDYVLSLPADFTLSYSHSYYTCYSNQKMYCCISGSGTDFMTSINCGKNDLSISFTEIYGYNGSEYVKESYCAAEIDNESANKICSSLGSYKMKANNWTPQGFGNSYKFYTLN